MNTGGPAFPRHALKITLPNGEVVPHDPGMSLRDYFAAKAMQGLLASGSYEGSIDAYAELAKPAYKVAEAMMKARDQ